MNLDVFVRLVRTRWVIIASATLIGLVVSGAITASTTPLYEAAARLFVSTAAGSSVSDLYEGNRLSQERVLSYTELLKGETLAQRTVEKLDLTISAQQLQEKITARSKLDTVLIAVTVKDSSPVRARDIANALSDEFVVMVRELETPRPGAQPDARVVVEQRASMPTVPVAPRPFRNIASGILLGLFSGVGLAFLRDMLDNTIKDQEVLEGITNAGLVGSIPISKDRREIPAIMFDRDNSSVAEAFRKLRTNLQFLAVDNPPRVIVVTSSVPNEGKSVTAINTALALAEADHNVVLIDGDMRRPSIDKYLNLVGSVGFSNVLGGSASLQDVLQVTKFPRLTVLAAGPIPPNPSELLGSQAARRLLVDLKAKFDYVIIDSSPLLAVTDAAVLAANADGALIMVRFGHTKREQVAHSVKNLNAVGAALLGAVLTMVPPRGQGPYSYNYNYYGSSYGEDTSQTGAPSKRRTKSETQPD